MENKKGILLVFGTAVISGFSVFINKFGVALTDPVAYTFLKNVCVALLISGMMLYLGNFRKFKEIRQKDWLKLVVIGVIGGSIPFILFFKGLALTSAAQGSFIQKMMFIFVIILAWKFLREKINTPFILGGILLFLGNALFLKKLDLTFGAGDWMILGATLFWAVENIISKKVLGAVDWKTVVWARMTFGSGLIFLFLLASGNLSQVSISSPVQLSWAIVTAVLLFAYQATWYSGLRYVPVGTATSILLLGSSITTFLSFVQKGQLEVQSMLASLAIILGIVIIVSAKAITEKSKALLNHVRS